MKKRILFILYFSNRNTFFRVFSWSTNFIFRKMILEKELNGQNFHSLFISRNKRIVLQNNLYYILFSSYE